MNPNYYPTQQHLSRRATVPISPLAPSASMIDPNLDQYAMGTMQHQQMIRNHGSPNMHNQMQTQMQGQMQGQMQNNSHLQSPMQTQGHMQSPMQNTGHFQPSNMPTNQSTTLERTLPPKQVSDQTMDDAYIQFIMYCNPSISADTETGELRKGFRTPPKSDGKSFSPYVLFELIAKLEDKKDGIDNWTKLVLELGVEPPNQDKGQSSQKVQQYAVRLKVICHLFFDNFLPSMLLCLPSCFTDLCDTALATCFPCRRILRLSTQQTYHLSNRQAFGDRGDCQHVS